MDTITYQPNPEWLKAAREVGSTFALGGGGTGCAVLLLGALLIGASLFLEISPGVQLFGLVILIVGMFVILGAITMWVLLLRSAGNENQEIQLTPESIVHKDGLETTRLNLVEIRTLKYTYEPGHWRGKALQRRWRPDRFAFTIVDRAGKRIALDIAYEEYLAPFEVRAIMRELLPRLPSTTRIDAHIRHYVETGELHTS